MIELDDNLVAAGAKGDLATVQAIINGWTDDDRRYGYTLYSPALAMIEALLGGHDTVVNWLIDNGHIDLESLQRLYDGGAFNLTPEQLAFLAGKNLPLEG